MVLDEGGMRVRGMRVICTKVGISATCLKCEHSQAHKPIILDPDIRKKSTCYKTDDCMLWISGKYVEVRVKCGIVLDNV